MAVRVATSVLLKIDIVLAGVAVDAVVVDIPNPEGRDLIMREMVLRRVAIDGGGLEANISVSPSSLSERPVFQVQGDGLGVGVEAHTDCLRLWVAADSLEVILITNTAETFVGKLYVEYWGGYAEEFRRSLNMQRYLGRRRIPILPTID